ncbi:DUF3552 domain-containing protein, partial [Patescibacteria group bacterium]|nr:DUF3552 domain-containing protein [Patescibacteria group bacterium]
MNISLILLPALGLGVGFGVGYLYRHRIGSQHKTSAEQQAVEILRRAEQAHAQKLEQIAESIKEAEDKHQDVLQKAKEKAIKILEEARLEEKTAIEALRQQQAELADREKAFLEKILTVDTRQQELEQEHAALLAQKQEQETLLKALQTELSAVSGLSREEALTRLLDEVEREQQEALLSRLRKLEDHGSEELDRQAKNLLATMIQRQAASHVSETTTTYVELPSEEMKGRIIGREGRNIKAIELLTGCELIIDETPGIVTISGFSPIRRQVAKRALEKLIADGRIHPGRIEEFVDEAKKDLAIDIKKAGEEALLQLGISPAEIDPKFTQILGRLKFRTSYGQNALMHSLEVAH